MQSLLTRLERLRSIKNGSDPGKEENPSSTSESPGPGHVSMNTSPANLDPMHHFIENHSPLGAINDLDTTDDVKPVPFDIVTPSISRTGRRFYWGASSIFSLTIEILQNAISTDFYTLEDPRTDVELQEVNGDVDDVQHSCIQIKAPDDDIRDLVDLYLVSLDTLYGFINRDETKIDLETYLSLRQQHSFSPSQLQGEQAHRWFRITMMCAISCANQARYRPTRNVESLVYFDGALSCVEKVTSEASPASLQALLLLIVFSLFYPKKGDIWKLLAHACRLAIELGYHAQDQYEYASDTGADNTEIKLRRSTFWGLYAIERIIGQLFGRGSDLPETIITTAYPSSNNSGSTFGMSPANELDEVQAISIARHYRLIYLRSEIFRSIYLPARPLNPNLDWLKERYATLYQWRQEQTVSDDMAGVATLTCDVGFDATICFLFQPLILQALRTTSTKQPDTTSPREIHVQEEDIFIPSDPFYCSVNLIRTYERIIRAPERSAVGRYPMTIMSAHYIYLASSMLVAYGLLQLKHNVKFLHRLDDSNTEHMAETSPIKWSLLLDIAGSCLVLLGWCAERWSGFTELLGIHNKLLARLTTELIRQNII